MTVQKELTKNIYVGNGQTTKFPVTFECPDNHPEYIKVYVTGKDNKLTETTNFSVDMTNKAITYPANGEPLAADEQLVIMRELPVRQLMNLVNNGPFFAEDIETAFDEGIMIAQQSSEKLGRALVVPPGSITFDQQIPIVPGKTFRVSDDGTHLQATEDPGKVIDEAKRLFDETAANAETAKKSAEEIKKIYDSGGLTPITDLMGSIGTALKRWGYIFANKVFAMNLPIVYKSVAEMKADVLLSAGMTACTLGYYSPNDSGAGTYIIRAKADGDVDDGGSLHELANGNIAELVVENGTVNVKQFGAKGDGVSDDSAFFAKAINAYRIVDLLNEKYCLLNTVNINKNIVLKNGSLYMPSSDKSKQVFWMPYVNDVNPLTVQFESIRFSSVRDKKTITFEDTELTSNLWFFQNKETQPCKLIFKNCDIAQCEYCVKKDDSTNVPFVVKDCHFHDSMMPIYSNGHYLDIRNSAIECVATNGLYHCVYMLLHKTDNVNIIAHACTFTAKNSATLLVFQVYLASGIEYSKAEDIGIWCYNCKFLSMKSGGYAGTAVYNHCIGHFVNCSLKLAYNGIYENCVIHSPDNVPLQKITILNSSLYITSRLDILVDTGSFVIYNSQIFVSNTFREDSPALTYPIYLAHNNTTLESNTVIMSNNLFHYEGTVHLIRIVSSNLIFLNNTINAKNTKAALIYATGDYTLTTAGNVVRANAEFPTENNIVIPV